MEALERYYSEYLMEYSDYSNCEGYDMDMQFTKDHVSQPRIKNDALCFDITDKIVVDVNVPFLVIVHGITFADLDFLNQPHQRRTV